MATSDVKPTIVVVAGAWLPQDTYAPFHETLRKLGYSVTGTDHPALDAPEPTPEKTNTAANAAHLRNVILKPLIEDEGEDVVLVMHSYGGCAGCAAATGLSKRARQREGKQGGVSGLIMASAFVFREGDDGSKLGEWAGEPRTDVLTPNVPSEGQCLPKDPIPNFIHDAPPEVAEEYVNRVKPWALAAFGSTQPPSAHQEPDMAGLCAYVSFEDDQALTKRQKEGVFRDSGRSWSVTRMPGSHCYPFVDGTGKLAGIVDEIIRGFHEAL